MLTLYHFSLLYVRANRSICTLSFAVIFLKNHFILWVVGVKLPLILTVISKWNAFWHGCIITKLLTVAYFMTRFQIFCNPVITKSDFHRKNVYNNIERNNINIVRKIYAIDDDEWDKIIVWNKESKKRCKGIKLAKRNIQKLYFYSNNNQKKWNRIRKINYKSVKWWNNVFCGVRVPIFHTI